MKAQRLCTTIIVHLLSYGAHRTTNGYGERHVSKIQQTSAPQRRSLQRARRTSGVFAQYIQDLSQNARVRRPRENAEAKRPGAFPARVVPVPCS